MSEEKDGSCELIIYCHACKSLFQLNLAMIALSLASNASIWDVYNYILTTKCRNCKDVIFPTD